MNVQAPRKGDSVKIKGDFAVHPEGSRRRKAVPVDVDGVRWLCAQAAPGHEFSVADDLTAVGYRAYAPHGVRVYPNARLANGKRGTRERDYPIFGRYVFVGVPAGLLFGYECHRFVTDVLGDQRGFQSVPARAIAAINAAHLGGVWDDLAVRAARPSRFQQGDAVRFASGPLEGLLAVVEQLPDGLRAVVRMGTAQLRVTVGAEVLEPV